MSVNRRSFIKSGALSALTAALGLSFVAPALGQVKPKRRAIVSPSPGLKEIPFGAQRSPLFYFTRETFQPYVGGIFTVSAGRKTVRMTLVGVTDYTPKAAARLSPRGVQPTRSFVLKFRSADKLTNLTTIYNVQHAALGKFPMFLTRREGPAGTSLYEAVFNHL